MQGKRVTVHESVNQLLEGEWTVRRLFICLLDQACSLPPSLFQGDSSPFQSVSTNVSPLINVCWSASFFKSPHIHRIGTIGERVMAQVGMRVNAFIQENANNKNCRALSSITDSERFP